MPKQVSIAYQTDKPLSQYAELARRAEELGFDGVSVYNDLYFQPAWLPLLEMARATRRVRLGPAAVNPFTCHPVHLAGNLALLDEASQGRAYLGMARGAWLDTLNLEPERPITALREALTIVRALLRGDRSGFRGDEYSLAPDHGLRWKMPAREIPFLLGSWGRHTLAACRGLVQEVKLGGTASPEVAAQTVAACGEDGPDVVVGAVTVVAEDAEQARALARREVALYLPVVAELDPGLQLEPKALQRLRGGEMPEPAELKVLIPDHVLDRVAFAGTAEQVAQQASRLFAAGVSRVEFGTPHGLSAAQGLELLGRESLSAIRAQV